MSACGIDLLVVDDHMIIRRGLVQILSENAAIGDIREAHDGASALRAVRERAPRVMLLDIALGERDGLDVLKNVRAEFPAVGVVMLSVYPESQFAVRAIRAGAGAYLNKGCSPDELFGAIERVAAGGVYVTPSIAELLARSVRSDEARAPHESLSNREFQVLELLARGHSVSDIAAQLSLSGNTISTYRARIFDKLGVRSIVELLHYANRHDLLG
ncbi:response regulator transcription factor [Pseudothauera nasutitermitis]|uniref:Response regulator transcription factor n=1 Tax=Pseudothauera nasutitermitis TaxID=2565930 RepID=A0A4S4B1R0_9RHOO|nr:response regulator transcription factor [Pseudothauera nasutitermitis]THF66484.1 response regulator transcription factor [Pseudothauera nasutitermitis]